MPQHYPNTVELPIKAKHFADTESIQSFLSQTGCPVALAALDVFGGEKGTINEYVNGLVIGMPEVKAEATYRHENYSYHLFLKDKNTISSNTSPEAVIRTLTLTKI
jgi:hypothetical protein